MLDENGMVLDTASIDVQPDDVLIIVDAQNDFMPFGDANLHGGRFGVEEGNHAAPLIAQMTEKFLRSNARVIATRDYHPIDHVSFKTQGGLFPPHCVQGTIGSKFYKPIGDMLTSAYQRYCSGAAKPLSVVFKGFHEDVDSFGSFPYSEEAMKVRLQHRGNDRKGCSGCLLDWTGCRMLKCSGLEMDGYVNVNAPPDVLSAHSSQTLAEHIGKAGNLYVCGMAMDFCVLDTALTARDANLFKKINIVIDASRAAYVPGVGRHGSGFLSSPREFIRKTESKSVSFVPAFALTHVRCPEDAGLPAGACTMEFPDTLGPLWLREVPSLDVRVDTTAGTYTVLDGVTEVDCRCGVKSSISNGSPRFLFPMTDMHGLSESERMTYLGRSHNPALDLLVNGAFMADTGVCHAVSAFQGPSSTKCIAFRGRDRFEPELAEALLKSGAFHRITLPQIQAKGYSLFTWLGRNEKVGSDNGDRWPKGAFVYLV